MCTFNHEATRGSPKTRKKPCTCTQFQFSSLAVLKTLCIHIISGQSVKPLHRKKSTFSEEESYNLIYTSSYFCSSELQCNTHRCHSNTCVRTSVTQDTCMVCIYTVQYRPTHTNTHTSVTAASAILQNNKQTNLLSSEQEPQNMMKEDVSRSLHGCIRK